MLVGLLEQRPGQFGRARTRGAAGRGGGVAGDVVAAQPRGDLGVGVKCRQGRVTGRVGGEVLVGDGGGEIRCGRVGVSGAGAVHVQFPAAAGDLVPPVHPSEKADNSISSRVCHEIDSTQRFSESAQTGRPLRQSPGSGEGGGGLRHRAAWPGGR